MRKKRAHVSLSALSPPPFTWPPPPPKKLLDVISIQTIDYLTESSLFSTNYNWLQLFYYSLAHISDSGTVIVVIGARDTPTHVNLKSPIKASIISLTCTEEQRDCEITASQQLNTCQSDPQWQATLLLPTLITQINIKLNTRPCSVNFYVVKNDWLFASLHQRDQKYPGRISERRPPSRNPAVFLLPLIYVIVRVPARQYLQPLWTYHTLYVVICV